MKKQIKWTAALSTAAIMTALTPAFSAPVMAQSSGWVQENDTWMFYDEDGYSVTDTWKKQDGQWYYLNEDGELSLNQQIDEYYVGSDGRRVVNQWVKLPNEDNHGDDDEPEFYWYYHGSDGKASVSRFRTIEGKTYYFDDEGHMVTGLKEIDGDFYYFGNSDSGVMKTGWVQLENENSDEEPSWHYFNSNGKMVRNEIDKRISGNSYTFEDGKMQTGWYKMPVEAESDTTADADAAENTSDTDTATASNAAAAVQAPAFGYQYYDSDGKRASGWRTIQGIPGVSDEDELYKFYFQNGKPHFADSGIRIFYISSNRYGFNSKGEMLTGLQTTVLEDGTTAVYYFGDDGVMRTGKQTIFSDEEGTNQTWFFHTEGDKRGQGYTGIRDNVIYENGLRKQADPSFRYSPVVFEGKNYLVNAAGTIQKAAASSKSSARSDLGDGFRDFTDLTDYVWTVDVNGVIQ